MQLHGWLALDKPLHMSSAQAVHKVKCLLPRGQKIGHAGTLDPLASGVLPIALGEATKTVPYAMDALKEYEFEVSWGQERTTDDEEGEVVQSSDKRPTLEEVQNILPLFTGEIEQTPPAFSAIKVDGKRAYELARGGEKVELKARSITVHSLCVIPAEAGIQRAASAAQEGPDASVRWHDTTSFTIACSKGTYIRSLARDMGRKLGCLGYVSGLKRVKVGNFSIKGAISLENLEKMVHKSASFEWLLPLQTVLDDIPAVTLNAESAARLRQGNPAPLPETNIADTIACIFEGKLVAMVLVKGGMLHPQRVFNY